MYVQYLIAGKYRNEAAVQVLILILSYPRKFALYVLQF